MSLYTYKLKYGNFSKDEVIKALRNVTRKDHIPYYHLERIIQISEELSNSQIRALEKKLRCNVL